MNTTKYGASSLTGGAYARFKDLLVRRKALGQWHAFENAATERALRQWCDENGVVVEQ